MMTSTRILQAAVLVAFALSSVSNTDAGDRTKDFTRTTETTIEYQSGTDLTARKSEIVYGPAIDIRRFLNHNAELEATSVQFMVEYHWSADVWHDHRVVAKITNVDTVWSGGLRTWEIYSFPSNGYMYGIQLVDQGTVPSLAPGETFDILTWLPPSVDFDATYVLILSPGDPNRDNDIAVSMP